MSMPEDREVLKAVSFQCHSALRWKAGGISLRGGL